MREREGEGGRREIKRRFVSRMEEAFYSSFVILPCGRDLLRLDVLHVTAVEVCVKWALLHEAVRN